MGVTITYLDLVEKVPLVVIRARRLAVRYATYAVVRTLTTIGLVLLFVVLLHRKAAGVLTGQLLSGIFFSTLLYVWTMRRTPPRYDREIGREMLAFGLPLLPGLLLYFVFQNASRWFLQRFQGADAVGLFALATQFGSILLLMNTAIQTAWPMFLYGAEKDDGVKAVYARALTYYLALAGFVAALVATFVPEVYRFMVDARFHASMRIVPLSLLAVILLGVHQFGGVGINLKEKTNWYVLVTGSSAATAVVLNFALVPRWGIVGAALATVLAYTVQAGMSLYISHRLYPVRYEGRRILTLALVLTGVTALARSVAWPSLWAALTGKASLLGLGVPALLWLLRFQTADEWTRVMRLLRRRPLAT
jgi:O-antigen/teichoic acid export membrane protein